MFVDDYVCFGLFVGCDVAVYLVVVLGGDQRVYVGAWFGVVVDCEFG